MNNIIRTLQSINALKFYNIDGYLAALFATFRLDLLNGREGIHLKNAKIIFTESLYDGVGQISPTVEDSKIKFIFELKTKFPSKCFKEELQPKLMNGKAICSGFPFKYNGDDYTGLIKEIILVTDQKLGPDYDFPKNAFHELYFNFA